MQYAIYSPAAVTYINRLNWLRCSVVRLPLYTTVSQKCYLCITLYTVSGKNDTIFFAHNFYRAALR